MPENIDKLLAEHRWANFLDPRIPDRLWAKLIPEPNSGCWLWLGYLDRYGYGQCGWRSAAGKHRSRFVHSVLYEVLRGPIPVGLEIDHRCRNSACANPHHLEAVTHAENVRRGLSGQRNRLKTHCPHGHPYNDVHTYWYQNRRYCRTCHNTRRERWRRRS